MVTAKRTYCSQLFDRQLRALRRTDKRGAAAAERAERLIKKIAGGDLSDEELISKQTKNGELRLNNCKKYDLGSGYRLISWLGNIGLCFIFIGSHDDCDRWLDNRRGEELNLSAEQLRPVQKNRKQVPMTNLPSELEQAEAEYEAYLDSMLDEETLHYLFRGLPRTC